MNIELPIWDARMFDLSNFLIFSKVVKDESEFLISIGFEPKNVAQVRNLKQSFRHRHLQKAAELYAVDINWFYGLSRRMRIPSKKDRPIDLITEAMLMMQAEEKKRNKKAIRKIDK